MTDRRLAALPETSNMTDNRAHESLELTSRADALIEEPVAACERKQAADGNFRA